MTRSIVQARISLAASFFATLNALELEPHNMDIARVSWQERQSIVGAWLRLSLGCGVQAAMADPLGL